MVWLRQLLRSVLRRPPFAVRTPEELVRQGAAFGFNTLTVLDAELAKRAQPGVSQHERSLYQQFLETHCPLGSGSSDSLSSLAEFKPPAKRQTVEVVGREHGESERSHE